MDGRLVREMDGRMNEEMRMMKRDGREMGK